MHQIADWLEQLNLRQYAQRFAENDIDVSVLRHLTDADLEKIGVSLGQRRKMLAAIAELPGASQSKREPAAGVEPDLFKVLLSDIDLAPVQERIKPVLRF